MEKKLFTFFLILTASVSAIYAQSGSCGNNVRWEFNAGTGVLSISGTGEMRNYDYTSASKIPWYGYRSYIKTVIINDGVSSIGDYAFYWCDGLTSASISSSVTSIGMSAFYACKSLVDICLPDSLNRIKERAFLGCESLISLTIPNKVDRIDYGAFEECISLTSVTIPKSLTNIGEHAFARCASLISIVNYAITPQTLKTKTFMNVNQSSCTLYVPKASILLYNEANIWKDFSPILPIVEQAIDQLQGDEVQSTKVVKDGQVLIIRNGKTYTMQGQEVK